MGSHRLRTATKALTVVIFVASATASYFEALDDSILHKIKWPITRSDETSHFTDDLNPQTGQDSIIMTSARNEKYRCTLPKTHGDVKEETGSYAGPNPFDLLAPLFNQFICTFKLETYWTYHLCHGKFIRQYHEEREGKSMKLQEYFLGKFDAEDLEKTRIQIEKDFSNPAYRENLPTKKIDGVNMPYLQINMTGGTTCDLNENKRSTRVLYVCYPQGKHEIYSLEETSTCEYEIVILSPLLCQHPDFKSMETGEHNIDCVPLGDAGNMPKALVELEAETFKIKHDHLVLNLETLLDTKLRYMSSDRVADAHSPEDIQDINELYLKPNKPSVHDSSALADFFSGKSCLTGGSSWWKFEYCYQKYVLQYHEESSSGSRTEIVLGEWNFDKHKEFLKKNPYKASLLLGNAKKSVVHLYTGGDQCDKSGQPRTVEVKFKCVEHSNPTSPSAIALYLLEPKVCEYSLTVESPLLCPIIKNADEFGQFEVSAFWSKTENDRPAKIMDGKFSPSNRKKHSDNKNSRGSAGKVESDEDEND